MTTVEKLLMQIFERKKSIIEQVKQQTELYNEHLATKLLIDGITPPTWLLSPNSSDSKELNKEDHLSKIVCRYPPHSVRCPVAHFPVYSNPVLSGHDDEFSDGSFIENLAFNKVLNRQDDPTIPAFSSEHVAGCALSSVPEPDASVNSPETQTDYNAPDQSLARIQRSKSRQKALELRNSAKALTKSGPSHENKSDSFHNHIRFSPCATNQAGEQDEQPKLAEPCLLSSQGCVGQDLDEADHLNKEKEMNAYSGQITRSRSYAKVPEFAKGSLNLGSSSRECKENASFHIAEVRRRGSKSIPASEQANYVNKFPHSAVPSTVCYQTCGDQEVDAADFLDKETEIDAYTGGLPSSKNSSKGRSCAPDSSKADSSAHDYQRIDTAMTEPGNGLPIHGSLLRVNPSNVLNGFEARESMPEDCKSCRKTCLSDHKKIDVYTGGVHNSTISSKCQSCAHDSSNANSSSDDYIAMPDSGSDLPIHGSVVRDNPSNVLNEDLSMSEDCKHRKERSAVPSLSSSQHNGCVGQACDLDIPSDSAKADGCILAPSSGRSAQQVNDSNEKPGLIKSSSGLFRRVTRSQTWHSDKGTHRPSDSAKADGCILAPSSGRSAQQVNDSNEKPGLIKSSSGLFRRVTRSQTLHSDKGTHRPVDYNQNPSFGGTISKSHCKQKLATNERHNTSGGQVIPPSYGTHDMLDENGNVSSFVATELVSHDCVDKSGSSSSIVAKQKRELESQLAPTSDSFAANELQNTSSGQVISPIYGTHDMFDENGNASSFVATELLSHDCVDKSGSYSFLDAKRKKELESQVAPTSDSFVLVQQKQLGFEKTEDCSLKAFRSNSGKRKLDSSPEKMKFSLTDPAVSLDTGISGGVNQLCLCEQSPSMSDVTSKGVEARRSCFEFDIRETPETQAEKFGPIISEFTLLKTSEDNTEADISCNVSDVHHEVDIMLPEMVDIPDLQIPSLKLHVEHGVESSVEQKIEEGNRSIEEKIKGQFISNAPESENLRASHCSSAKEPRAEPCDCLIGEAEMTNPICVVLENIKPIPMRGSQTSACLEGEVSSQHADSSLGHDGLITRSVVRSPHVESSSPERRCQQASMESWPQLKRRKIEQKKTHSFSTSPSFRVGMPHSTEKDSASMSLENKEVNMDTVLLDILDVNKSTCMQIPEDLDSNLTEGIKSMFSCQNEEVGYCQNEKNEQRNSSVSNNEQLGAALGSSSLTKKEDKDSRGCFVEGMRINQSESRQSGDGQCRQDLYNLDFEDLDLTSTMFEGIESPEWEQKKYSVLPPSDEELELIDVDQSMPVFEGFVVDAQAEIDELNLRADGIDLNKLNLQTTAIERASFLAEMCRSASLNTPLSHFSSAFRYQGTKNLFHSVPNGHLERLNFEVDKHLQSDSSVAHDDYNNAFEGMPYSDSPAYSDAHYGWDAKSRQGSPVGSLWERLSSHTGSSEKRSISNPELTCFPIEEDPSISEENRAVDENEDDVEEEIDSLCNHRDKRQALKDLTNFGSSPDIKASAQEEMLRADSTHFINTKLSVAGTDDKVQWSVKNQHRDKTKARDKPTSRKNKTLSIGTRKAKESINNSISKPNKTSLKREDQKLSLKEARKNIISNVSSFIPLVQQKQAATACAGKRDVKVKALEAAEAAKRLAEKRENERKMRKEALKVERAKLEEKNLRNIELEKKKKDEERKKKDADIIARKRQREEEGRKEKEKKRIRLEARQHRREQEDKMRAEKVEKAEKEKQRSKDEQMNRKKESHNELRNQQNMEMVRGNGVALKKTETKLAPAQVAVTNEECSTSGLSCEAGKVMDKSPKNEDLIVQNNQGKSYDISPYQCSDDEDEDDKKDELPNKKYVPSWASKSCVALRLPFQQEMDPDVIFPKGRSCSMDEVLLPRKLQQKNLAV